MPDTSRTGPHPFLGEVVGVLDQLGRRGVVAQRGVVLVHAGDGLVQLLERLLGHRIVGNPWLTRGFVDDDAPHALQEPVRADERLGHDLGATVDQDGDVLRLGVEDHGVNFGSQLKQMVTLGTADIGDDELSIVITGLPPGVNVQGLTFDFVNGEYLIKLPGGLDDLDKLTLTLPQDYAGDGLHFNVRLVNSSSTDVLAMSGRAIEAAGDVDILMLDKTGTITLGNRQAHAFIPVDGATPEELADAAGAPQLAATFEAYQQAAAAGADEAFGKNVCSLDDKPTNGEFIALVADRLSVDRLSVNSPSVEAPAVTMGKQHTSHRRLAKSRSPIFPIVR